MPNAIEVRIKNDREFKETLRKYAMVSKRTIPEIVNKKALFITRGALWHTRKASKEAIKKDLLELAYTLKTSSKGKVRKFHKMSSTVPTAPIAALLINWKRGQQGRMGLYGDAMKKAVKSFVGRRQRSVAYIRSGWIPAIKTLNPFVKSKAGAKPLDPEARVQRRDKGWATPAREGWNVKAIIVNAIAEGSSKDAAHHGKALVEYGEPALAAAIQEEEASMRGEIEKRLREGARSCGIRTN